MKTICFLFSLVFLLPLGVEAQHHFTQYPEQDYFNRRYQGDSYKSRRTLAYETASKLQNGTLIVRLLSYQEKIDKLEELGREAQAQMVRDERKSFNKRIQKYFKEQYAFSEVLFAYGTSIVAYQKGEEDNIFLDENLQVDPNIKMKEGPFYYFGSYGNNTFYLLNEKFEVIEAPAPNQIRMNNKKLKLDIMERKLRRHAANYQTSR